ncbi:MAG: nascent polypeptide-associated complex protein [Candidatus Diapherotrites archaeon]|nr:nascent polypeptide-associated complex protein [Candidatus Diapherotrites archaeon]
MPKLLKQFGIQNEELKATRVIFETPDGRIVIDAPQVTAMKMSGQMIYSVMGDARKETAAFSDEDVDMVATGAGVSKEKAREALTKTAGDIAEAIVKIKESKSK